MDRESGTVHVEAWLHRAAAAGSIINYDATVLFNKHVASDIQ